jgi:hypothetical protein
MPNTMKQPTDGPEPIRGNTGASILGPRNVLLESADEAMVDAL